MKTYCYSCGAKMEFLLRDKPKFCSKCGARLGQSEGVNTADLSDESVTEEDEVTRVPSVSGLDFEFDVSLTPRPETLGSLVGTRDGDNANNPLPLSRRPKMTKEQSMEQFKKEAGSLRRGSIQKDDTQ